MAVAHYIDHHIPKAITQGLRLRGVDCLTAWKDNAAEMDDPDLPDRATARASAGDIRVQSLPL